MSCLPHQLQNRFPISGNTCWLKKLICNRGGRLSSWGAIRMRRVEPCSWKRVIRMSQETVPRDFNCTCRVIGIAPLEKQASFTNCTNSKEISFTNSETFDLLSPPSSFLSSSKEGFVQSGHKVAQPNRLATPLPRGLGTKHKASDAAARHSLISCPTRQAFLLFGLSSPNSGPEHEVCTWGLRHSNQSFPKGLPGFRAKGSRNTYKTKNYTCKTKQV